MRDLFWATLVIIAAWGGVQVGKGEQAKRVQQKVKYWKGVPLGENLSEWMGFSYGMKELETPRERERNLETHGEVWLKGREEGRREGWRSGYWTGHNKGWEACRIAAGVAGPADEAGR